MRETPPPAASRPALPGDRTASQATARMLRVNHAGEYGAKRIYSGQLAVLGNGPKGPVLRHMAEQEEAHLKAFQGLLNERRVRPTLFSPLWHVAGFALGAGTALLGERAAMACTVAVEEVIDEHYQHQAETLGTNEPELKALIEQFRAEELEHRDIGLAHEAEQAPCYGLLTRVIKAASKTAIWLSSRI